MGSIALILLFNVLLLTSSSNNSLKYFVRFSLCILFFSKSVTKVSYKYLFSSSNSLKKFISLFLIAFAVAIPTKHTKYTAKVLEALIDGLNITDIHSKFSILSDNGSEFKKDFDALLERKELTHYWTYPRSPKMNAHNERFNRSIQEQFVDYDEDLLFSDIELFNEKMADWLIDYNTKIPHHSLQMKTPVQYLIETNPQCQMLWTNTQN